MILSLFRYFIATILFGGIVYAAALSGDSGYDNSCKTSGSTCNVNSDNDVSNNCSIGVSCEKK